MPNNPGVVSSVCTKWSKGTGGPSGSEHFNLVTHPSWPAEVAQPVPYDLFQVTAPVNRQNRKPGDPCHTLARDNAAHAAVAFTRCDNGGDASVEVTPTMRCGSNYSAHPAVAFNWQNGGGYGNANEGLGITIEGTGPIQRCNTPAVAHAVAKAIGFDGFQSDNPKATHQATIEGTGPLIRQRPHCVATQMTVRRLTPRECERLQAFPDDYTLIPWRKKPADECPDGPRYKALGNSMACNCMAWIGERIAAIESREQ